MDEVGDVGKQRSGSFEVVDVVEDKDQLLAVVK